jgi:hypothetical protein
MQDKLFLGIYISPNPEQGGPHVVSQRYVFAPDLSEALMQLKRGRSKFVRSLFVFQKVSLVDFPTKTARLAGKR